MAPVTRLCTYDYALAAIRDLEGDTVVPEEQDETRRVDGRAF